MTADWKRKPLEQVAKKPSSKTEHLQARLNEALARTARQAQTLHLMEMQAAMYREQCDDASERARKNELQAQLYRQLCARGVMVEEDGEFKFLKGEKEIGDFLERQFWSTFGELGKDNPYSQALARSMLQTKQAVSQSIVYTAYSTDKLWPSPQKPW